MAFPVGTIVKKIGESKKYKVVEENIPDDLSICVVEPKTNPAKFTFKNSELEVA